jgi:hypothetical protein
LRDTLQVGGVFKNEPIMLWIVDRTRLSFEIWGFSYEEMAGWIGAAISAAISRPEQVWGNLLVKQAVTVPAHSLLVYIVILDKRCQPE